MVTVTVPDALLCPKVAGVVACKRELLTKVVANGLLFNNTFAPGKKPDPGTLKPKLLAPGVWLTGAMGRDKNGTALPGPVALAGSKVRRVLCEIPLLLAVMVAVEIADTGSVLIENSPLLAPAGIVMGESTPTDALSLVRVTVSPLDGAGLVSCTVPMDFVPPTSVAGSRLTALGAVGVPGGTIVRNEVLGVPWLNDAVIFTRAMY